MHNNTCECIVYVYISMCMWPAVFAPYIHIHVHCLASQDHSQCPKEFALRRRISCLVQCLVVLLGASNTLSPCLKWYATKLNLLPLQHKEEGVLRSFRMPKIKRREEEGVSEELPTLLTSVLESGECEMRIEAEK